MNMNIYKTRCNKIALCIYNVIFVKVNIVLWYNRLYRLIKNNHMS